MGVFYGCQKNQAIEEPSSSIVSKSVEDKLLIDEAKIYFESKLDELRKKKEADKNKLKVRDNQTTDATFDGLDVIPKWDNAKIIRQNGSSFVETPYHFEGNLQFGLSISKNNNIAPVEKSASRLIVKKNKNGVQSANFMSVSADDEYLNGNNTSLKNFTYESVPNKFKGNEMHFNIDGSFKNGWHFADGKANGTIKKVKAGSLRTRDECEYNVCVEIARYSIQVANYKLTTIVVDCNSYSTRLLVCNGWISPAEWNNNDYSWVDTNSNDEPVVHVPTEEEKWLDKNDTTILFNNPCAKYVYNNLTKNAGNFLYKTVEGFFGDKPVIHLKWDLVSNLTHNGEVVSATTTYSYGDFTATIRLNSSYFATNSPTEIAGTMIHEALHAEIFRKIQSIGGPSNLNSSNFPTLFNLYESFVDFDHEYMANYYVSKFANALKEFDSTAGLNIKNDDVYKAIAWGGLEGTSAWGRLSESDKTKYRTLMATERSAGGCQ